MGLAEVQGALARLYIDPALRDRFFADPAGVGVELGLGAEESREAGRRLAAAGRAVRRLAPAQAAGPGPSGHPDRRAGAGRPFRRAVRALRRGVCAAGVEGRPRRRDRVRRCARAMGETIGRPGSSTSPATSWRGDRPHGRDAGRSCGRSGSPSDGWCRDARSAGSVRPGPTLAIWWRPTGRGRIRHVVIGLPGLALR